MLSTIRGMPASCAIEAIASISPITLEGLDTDSIKIAFDAPWNIYNGPWGMSKKSNGAGHGGRDYQFENKNYEYEKPYSIIDSTYDYICTKLVNKIGFFVDLNLPLTKKSIIISVLEFIYNL